MSETPNKPRNNELENTQDSSSENSNIVDAEVLASPQGSKKMQAMFQELQMMASHRGRGGFDISKFTPQQIDKLLETVSQNESNSFKYHEKRIDAVKDIELAKIKASSIAKINVRYLTIFAAIFVIGITVLLIVLNDKYLINWFTFIISLGGGVGIGRATKSNSNESKKNPLVEQEDD